MLVQRVWPRRDRRDGRGKFFHAVVLAFCICTGHGAYGGTLVLGGGLEYSPQPVINYDDDYKLVPLIIYLGGIFRILGDTAQLSFAGNPTLSADVNATIRRMNYEIPGRTRHRSVDMGIGLFFNKKPHRARVEIVSDVTGQHHGQAVNAYWLTEFKRGGWKLMPKLKLMWESENIADYYYGTAAYQGRAGFYPSAGIETNFDLSAQWVMTLEVSVKDIANIKDSPIVSGDSVVYGFLGVMYVFK